jgi:hypothetical protein
MNPAEYLEVVKTRLITDTIVASVEIRREGTYLAVQDLYMPWLRSVREIQSVAWFSVRYAGFPEANLLRVGGGLTVVGQNWLDWRWR